MLLVTSLTTLGLSLGSLFVFGSTAPPILFEVAAVVGVLSAFVAICSTEATLSS